MFLPPLAVRPQPVPSHDPRGEHHPEGHRGAVPVQAGGQPGGQELHQEVPGLQEGRAHGRGHHGQGDLPLPATVQAAAAAGGRGPAAAAAGAAASAAAAGPAAAAAAAVVQHDLQPGLHGTELRGLLVRQEEKRRNCDEYNK